MICANCGARNDAGEEYCRKCGALLSDPHAGSSAHAVGNSSTSGFVLVPTVGGSPVELASRVVVGRMNSCDIAVQDKSVSREHALLALVPGGYLVEDLHSTNGTLLNGQRLAEPTVARSGDVLTFGTVDFRLDVAPRFTPEEEASVPDRSPVLAQQAEERVPGPSPTDASAAPEPRVAPVATVASEGKELQTVVSTRGDTNESRDGGSTEAARLVDEVVATAAHLSDLAQRLAETASSTVRAPGVEGIRDLVASVPAAPMTPEELGHARSVLNGLAANPSDFDLLVKLREMVPQLARLLEQHDQVERVLQAVAGATREGSPL